MITKTINKEKTKVTFSTLLTIDGRSIRLSYSRLLGYLKDNLEGYSFEEYFLFPKEAYTNEPVPTKDGLKPMWHAMYHQIKASNYNQKGSWHEVTWEDDMELERKGHYLTLKNSLRNHIIAIPAASQGEIRTDCLSHDGRYHYDCKKGEFHGIEITVKGKPEMKIARLRGGYLYSDIISEHYYEKKEFNGVSYYSAICPLNEKPSKVMPYKFPFIEVDLKYSEGIPGGKKDRVLEDYSAFKEGQTYYTKFQTREKFTLYKIDKIISKTETKIIKFWGTYENSEHLGLCPIEPSTLMKHYVEPEKELDYYLIIEQLGSGMGLNPGDTLVPIEDSEYCEHWSPVKGTLDEKGHIIRSNEHSLCRDKVHISCITEKNCKPIYK